MSPCGGIFFCLSRSVGREQERLARAMPPPRCLYPVFIRAGTPPGAIFLCEEKYGKESPKGCGPLETRGVQACACAQRVRPLTRENTLRHFVAAAMPTKLTAAHAVAARKCTGNGCTMQLQCAPAHVGTSHVLETGGLSRGTQWGVPLDYTFLLPLLFG